MLSEISESEKDKYHMISLTWNLKNKKRMKKRHRPRNGLLNRELVNTRRWEVGVVKQTKGITSTLNLMSTKKCIELFHHNIVHLKLIKKIVLLHYWFCFKSTN